MPRKLRIAVSVFLGLLAVAIFASGADAEGSQDESTSQTASSAVVRISVSERGHSGIGAIVTSEGHIVLPAAPHLRDQPLFIFLADGRRANGVLLGWSSEWNISLAKITDKGSWPLVEMASAPGFPKVNDPCFTVGYILEENGWTKTPTRRGGHVTESSQSLWFSSSIAGNQVGKPFFAFGPLFDMHGNLLGNTAVEAVNGDSTQLHSDQIKTLWPQLLRHGNVDELRLRSTESFAAANRPYQIIQLDSASTETPSQVEQCVSNCTVGLRKGRGQRWSGVIVSPDGWIATCGHGGQMPNDDVTVEFPDGRNIAARVTGVNPITDIALVKIQQPGPWPYAPLADTSDLDEGASCWFIGYPSERKGRKPLVRKIRIIRPKDTVYSHLIYTDKSYLQFGGDSGGGVFDQSGRLLGINQGKEPNTPGRHARVETLRAQWDSLVDGAGNK